MGGEERPKLREESLRLRCEKRGGMKMKIGKEERLRQETRD